MKEITKLRDYFSCPCCGVIINLDDRLFESYFNSKDNFCPECSQNFDLWEVFLHWLDTSIAFALHYSLLGCVNSRTTISIKPNESFELNLNEEIANGDLLHIIFTVTGSNPTFPMINATFPYHFLYKYKKMNLTGLPLNETSGETNVNISYWVAPEDVKADLSNMLLLDAFKFFTDENYRYMIISAHSSIEILQFKFFERIFSDHKISKGKTDEFLKRAATYSYQLNPLLPLLSEIMEFPMLNKEAWDGLKSLRKSRNNLIHRGETNLSDTRKLKKELISAFFAFKYFKIIHNIKWPWNVLYG